MQNLISRNKTLRIIFPLNLFAYELAFLVNIQGDFETLKKYCSPQLIERCEAEHVAYKDRGIFYDNKVRLLLFLFFCVNLSYCSLFNYILF